MIFIVVSNDKYDTFKTYTWTKMYSTFKHKQKLRNVHHFSVPMIDQTYVIYVILLP